MDVESPLESLQRATELAGGQSALARKLGVSQAAVWKWLARGVELPPKHVLTIEAATGVSKHDLRPDIYPREADLSSCAAPVACDAAALSHQGGA